MQAATDDAEVGEGSTVQQSPTPTPTPTTNHADTSAETEGDRKASHSSGKDVDRRPSIAVGSGSRTHGSELKPIGIINEQNTCFLNSTFQAVRLLELNVERGDVVMPVLTYVVVELDWSVDLTHRTISIIQSLPYSDLVTAQTRYRPKTYTCQSTRCYRTTSLPALARHSRVCRLAHPSMAYERCRRRYLRIARERISSIHVSTRSFTRISKEIRPI